MSNERPSRSRLVVPQSMQRSHPAYRKEGLVDQTAIELLGVLAEVLGAADLAGKRVLDVGCGVKFTRAILNNDLEIGSYTGLDVDLAVIDFLTDAVDDERFAFDRIDVYNERYNPTGTRLDSDFSLPVTGTTFDAITGYSLFTHLDPHDFLHMARIMREAASPRTRLVVTAYLDLHSDGGHGFIDTFSEGFGASMLGCAKGGYLDVYPDDPLNVTLYDEGYARALFAEAGWTVDEILDPTPAAQHTVVASAA